jgi:Mn2+/Fe2+ NRAMP family transporter
MTTEKVFLPLLNMKVKEKSFENSWFLKIVSYGIAIVLTILNAILVYQLLTEI